MAYNVDGLCNYGDCQNPVTAEAQPRKSWLLCATHEAEFDQIMQGAEEDRAKKVFAFWVRGDGLKRATTDIAIDVGKFLGALAPAIKQARKDNRQHDRRRGIKERKKKRGQ